MTDNELINIIATQLELAVANAGWDYKVIQKNDPQQEGIPSEPGIFFEKLFDHPYGFPIINNTYNSVPDNFSETNLQVYETTFQVTSLVIQNPDDLTIPTASDAANQMLMFMQSRTTVAALRALGVSLLRITQVRNPYFVDDRNRFEGHPNFDIIVYSKREITFTVPAAVKAVGAPSPVPPGAPGSGVFPVLE